MNMNTSNRYRRFACTEAVVELAQSRASLLMTHFWEAMKIVNRAVQSVIETLLPDDRHVGQFLDAQVVCHMSHADWRSVTEDYSMLQRRLLCLVKKRSIPWKTTQCGAY
jgi:hypothetical protein